MKGVYLCARKHRLPCDLDYNDIVGYDGINLCCDMLEVDINKYDFVIATPPCNYYSRANYRREISEVAKSTKHLLPAILDKLKTFNKPFIVENVMNDTLLPKTNFIEFDFGQHHFYTNVLLLFSAIPERQNKQYVSRNKRDGNYNVDLVLKVFLETIGAIKC